MHTAALAVLLAVAPPVDPAIVGPPAPPSREEVVARSFPAYVPEDAIGRRIRTPRRVAWSLFGCDIVSTLAAPAREVNPLAFGSKPLGLTLTALGTYGSLRAEEHLLRRQSLGWANVARYGRRALTAFACGWNLSLSF